MNKLTLLTFAAAVAGFHIEKAAWVWELRKVDPWDVFGTQIAFHISNSEPGHAMPTTTLPTSFEGLNLTGGEYFIYNNFRFSDPLNPPMFDLDALHLNYAFNVDVTAIPLPVSIMLFAPPLLLLYAARKRA